MSFKNLLEPVTERGIKNTNFFEGRLLSGRDLSQQETANQFHRQQLGRTLGHGVIEGLNVSVESDGGSETEPVVRIGQGMALTLDGEILEVPEDYIDIKLSRKLDKFEINSSTFSDCNDLPSETLVPSGEGLYILLMSPACDYREYAPKSGLQQQGIARECGRAYKVEGIQFRLVKFDPALMPDISEQTRRLLSDELLNSSNPVDSSNITALSQMRNIVAHVCFGTGGIAASARDPSFISKPNNRFGIDALHGLDEGLTNKDVPLALIYWNLSGIVFVDNWAVKRKASHKDIVGYSVPSFTRHSYPRADESRLQFQEHLEYLQERVVNLSQFNANQYFRYLPPVGYLPLDNGGFSETEFFQDLTVRNSVFVEAAKLVPIAQLSMTYWPIDLESEELIWLYRTRENAQAADDSTEVRLQEYILFASGHSPYFGNARFNVSKWDYSNYGSI